MRKVICIDDSEFNKNRPANVPCPAVGDELTVSKAWIDVFDNNDPVFFFIEYGNRHMFSQRFFATLPDATADEMQEEEKEVIVNLETVLV